eukprot:11360_1
MGCCCAPAPHLRSINSHANSHASMSNHQIDGKTTPHLEIDTAGSGGAPLPYSNSFTNNGRSNTNTACTMTPSNATPQKRDSLALDEHTQQILNDDDIFSREAIRVSHQFWNDNLLTLTDDRRQEIGVTLYAQMFRKMPKLRKIFLRNDIDETSRQFLRMIGWLIMELNARSCDVWARIKIVGLEHRKWGITYEHYLPMLQAFHLTLQENFPKAYTLRIKFCIENLFMNAAKIMTGKDFITIFAERVRDLETLEFLDSLDACLAHKTGREYFERYLEQTFCAEYVIFLRYFDEFKQLGNTQQRYETAKEIYDTHFHVNGEAPIEFSDPLHIKKYRNSEERIGKI